MLRPKLIRYISKKYKDSKSAFTLVELVIVVMIIGILSSIAIPSFKNASDKAKQKEPTSLISNYLRAAQSYYLEFGDLPKYSSDLGEYMSVTACTKNYPSYCKSVAPADYTKLNSNSWSTPSGHFDIYMRVSDNKITFRALPVPVYINSGYGVSACYNPKTGVINIKEQNKRLGREVPQVNC